MMSTFPQTTKTNGASPKLKVAFNKRLCFDTILISLSTRIIFQNNFKLNILVCNYKCNEIVGLMSA